MPEPAELAVAVVGAGAAGVAVAGAACDLSGGLKPIVTHQGGLWYAQQQQLESHMILFLPSKSKDDRMRR